MGGVWSGGFFPQHQAWGSVLWNVSRDFGLEKTLVFT